LKEGQRKKGTAEREYYYGKYLESEKRKTRSFEGYCSFAESN
jgi:hypothetical protein